LHSIPASQGRIADYRIGEDQSAGAPDVLQPISGRCANASVFRPRWYRDVFDRTPRDGAYFMGSNYCPKLLTDITGGMIATMRRDRGQQATPDLFSTETVRDVSPSVAKVAKQAL
jgi:hypothetical protein